MSTLHLLPHRAIQQGTKQQAGMLQTLYNTAQALSSHVNLAAAHEGQCFPQELGAQRVVVGFVQATA